MTGYRVLAALAALAAALPAAAAPESGIAVKVAVTPTFKSLDDKAGCGKGRHPETLFLAIANEGPAELRLTSVTLQAPRDLELCGGRAAEAVPGASATILERKDTVPAGGRHVVAIPVGARDRLRSGSYPLVLEVAVEDGAAGNLRQARLLATSEVQLQIQGISDVLKVLGVPTLFLLPGFLALVAFAAFRTGDWENATKPTNPAFWIIAVPFSMALSLLFTAVLGSGDLSQPFNLGDVAWVWLISLAIGTVAGCLVRIYQKSQARKSSERSKRDVAGRTIGANDPALVVLETLGRLGTGWPPLWHDWAGHEGFLAGPDAADNRWLIPQTQLTGERPDSMAEDRWRELQREFDTFLAGSVTAESLAEALKGRFQPLLPLRWRNASAPYQLGPQDRPSPAGAVQFVFRE